jgi:hypothetical protein
MLLRPHLFWTLRFFLALPAQRYQFFVWVLQEHLDIASQILIAFLAGQRYHYKLPSQTQPVHCP